MKAADKVVAYFNDEEAGIYSYAPVHPWRPLRSTLVHQLVAGYGLEEQLVLHRPRARSFEELTAFHADDYINLLKHVTPDNQDEYLGQMKRFNMGAPGESDCPVFDGMLDYFSLLSGGSVDGAALLAAGKADIALNWAGGMHHAKKAEASGFCYVNDIVLGILELLKVYRRVLYVDIDIHHGDGVEEAFYLTDRVMTVSFHKYGDYFPGTGALTDTGYGPGKLYTVNVPLQEGMDDESYRFVYEPIMEKVMAVYQPEAVVVCSGADSLSGDRLGCFNLSLQGHSNCIEFLARYHVPMLVVGGGGYTLRNVARCWCYETGRLMGIDLPDRLPASALAQHNYYMDNERLRIEVSNMHNHNKREQLEEVVRTVLDNLSRLPPAPSVGIESALGVTKVPDLPEEDMEARGGGQAHDDARVAKPGDSERLEREEEGERAAGVGGRSREWAEAPSRGLQQQQEEQLGQQPLHVAAVAPGSSTPEPAPAGASKQPHAEAAPPAVTYNEAAPQSAVAPSGMDVDAPAPTAPAVAAGTSNIAPPAAAGAQQPEAGVALDPDAQHLLAADERLEDAGHERPLGGGGW